MPIALCVIFVVLSPQALSTTLRIVRSVEREGRPIKTYLNYSLILRCTTTLLLSCLLALAQDPGAAIGNTAATWGTGLFMTGLCILGIVIGGLMLLFGHRGAGGVVMFIAGGTYVATHGQQLESWIAGL